MASSAANAAVPEVGFLVDDEGERIFFLGAEAGTFTEERGVGNPAVVWDNTGATGQYVMYFETKLPEWFMFNAVDDATAPGLGWNKADYDDCRRDRLVAQNAVVWAIGRATSPDGFDWTVDPTPVVLPQPGTYFACQAAQPAVIRDSLGKYHLWFKAMQWNPNPSAIAPCDEDFLDTGDTSDTDNDPITRPFGCYRVTGLGYASSNDGITWTPSAVPVITGDELAAQTGQNPLAFGFPKAVHASGTWHVWYTVSPSIFHASGSVPAGPFTADPNVALSPNPDISWMGSRLVSPSTVCDEPTRRADPVSLEMYFGARKETVGPPLTVDEVSLAQAVSFDATTWLLPQGNPIFRQSGEDLFAQLSRWEVVDDDENNDVVAWYSRPVDDNAISPHQVGFASTLTMGTTPPYATIQGDALDDKWCGAPPVDTGDTGDTGDTDDTDDTDTGDTDTGDTDTGDTDTGDTDTGDTDTGDTDTGDTDTGDTDTGDTADTADTGGEFRGGCSCGGSDGSAALLLPLLLLFASRRREQESVDP